MGIVYKVLKHRRGLEMDAVRQRPRPRQPPADADRKFPAEYILQLCKFLAEKSKRNKQQQQQQVRASGDREASFEFEEVVEAAAEADAESEAQREAAAVEALALIKHSRLGGFPATTTTTSALPAPAPAPTPTKPVLVDRVVNTRSQPHRSPPSLPPAASSCAAQFQRGHKQDILQKIRSQIFERKRQRQLATMQRIGGVWRPW